MSESPTTDEASVKPFKVSVTGPGLVLEQQIDAETAHRIASLLILPGTGARRGRPPGSTQTKS